MFIPIIVFLAAFICLLFVVGFVVVNTISVIFILFGITLTVFGIVEYLASGFLVYIRGYFSKDNYKYSDLLIKNNNQKETNNDQY